MEDLEDDMRAPRIDLAALPDDKEVKRSDSFCSRIVQQNTRHCDRYIRDLTFLKLLKYSYPDRTEFSPPYPRPLKSPFPCYQCHRRFQGPPVFIPMAMLEGFWDEWGNFCSGPCANTYLHHNMPNVDLSLRAAELFYYLQEVYGFKGTQIGFAPHFTLHTDYGGHLTDEAFARELDEPTVTSHIRMRPFFPTDVVIEVVAPAGDILEGVVGIPMPPTMSGRDQHKWEIRGIKAPALDATEIRLASLPKLEKRPGIYELYLQRKSGFAPDTDHADHADVMAIAAPKKSSQKRKTAVLADVGAPPPPSSQPSAPSQEKPVAKNSLANMVTAAKSRKKPATKQA